MRPWAVVALLVLLPALGRMEFTRLAMDIDIRADGSCVERIDILGENRGERALEGTSFSLLGDISDVAVFDAEGNLTAAVREARWSTRELAVTFRRPLAANATVNLTIAFTTADLVHTVEPGMDFSLTYRADDPVLDFVLTAHLPEGYVLPVSLERRASQSRPVLYPNAIVRTDGRRLSFEWRRGGLEPGEEMTFFVGFEKAARPTVVVREPPAGGGTPFAVGLAVLFFVLGYSVGARRMRREEAAREEELLSVMEANERAVIEALIASDGPMMQRELQRVTDFSKAKLSRVLSGLEARGIVARAAIGNTNRVTLRREALGR